MTMSYVAPLVQKLLIISFRSTAELACFLMTVLGKLFVCFSKKKLKKGKRAKMQINEFVNRRTWISFQYKQTNMAELG